MGSMWLVRVDWAMLLWFGLLIADLIANIIKTRSNQKVKKAIVEQNQLVHEQNDMILKQNGQLATVIVRVCSKSVRDRKAAEEEKNKEESEV